MAFYQRGRGQGNFQGGIRLALQSILVSPRFLFRLEPRSAPSGGPLQPIGDVALASRLSFFLWGRAPDDRLLADAKHGLHQPALYRGAVQRLLTDARSSALASRFARQWLRLQDLDSVSPDKALYPAFDPALAASMLRETELFFDSIVRADRSVLDLLSADTRSRTHASRSTTACLPFPRRASPGLRCPSHDADCSDRAASSWPRRSPDAPHRSCAANG